LGETGKGEWELKIAHKPGLDAEFLGLLRQSILAAHEILIRAELATPEVREYLNGVRVIVSNRMIGSAGIARLRKREVRLNGRLLMLHQDQLLTVLVHEIAHLLDDKLNGGEGHGPTWKRLMVRMGFEPERYHKMVTQGVRSLAR
jgi:predicted metal-dependent hydrolase